MVRVTVDVGMLRVTVDVGMLLAVLLTVDGDTTSINPRPTTLITDPSPAGCDLEI